MLENLKPVFVPQKCKLARWMETLEKSDVKLMESYLDDETFATQTMSTRLYELGVQMGPHAITKHRRKECLCYRVG